MILKRLKDLITRRQTMKSGQVPYVDLVVATAHLRGYQECWDVVKPTIVKAKRVIASWASENIEGVDANDIGYWDLQGLRDTLMALDLED